MSLLRLGVIGTSAEENEDRLPIQHDHPARIEGLEVEPCGWLLGAPPMQ